MRLPITGVFALLLGGVALAQANEVAPAARALLREDGAYALPGARTFSVRSASQRQYRIFVWAPDEAPPASGFPVLTTLDGNAYFAAAVSALQVMAPANPALKMKASPVTAMIVVGVGYPGDEPFAVGERAYDYLPPLTGPDDKLPREGWPGHPPGGADQLLAFLVDELRPALTARYRMDPARHSLMGHSLGGFFTLYALMKRPGAFRNYIAISPSLWWDGSRLVAEAGRRRIDESLTQLPHILVAVAKDELPDSPERSTMMRMLSREMVQNLNRMSEGRLAATYLELSAEDHQSMQLAALPEALRVASQ